jgi:hypothetical protein
MPANPPMTIPVDPHLLAQWRFDERRRSDASGEAASQGATMVLGRWPDRLEFRTRAEVPGVAESARAIAAVTDGPAYRAQLLEIAGRIASVTGIEADGAAAPAPAAQPAPEAAPAPTPEVSEPAADDWLSRLDATIATAPPPQPAARDATFTAPPEPSSKGSADLPDFLTSWQPPANEPDAPAAQAEDDAFYIPPVDEPTEPPEAPAPPPPSVPVLDFMVEPDDASTDDGNSPSHAPDASADGSGEEAADGGGSPFPPEPWRDGPAPAAGSSDHPGYSHEASAAGGPMPPPLPQPQTSTEAPAVQGMAASDRGAGIRQKLASLGADLGMQVWGTATGGAEASSASGVDGELAIHLAALDVVWAQDGQVVAAFLVDPPSAAEGLLAVADVLAVGSGARLPVYLVAPEDAREALRSAAVRPAFARMQPPVGEACAFIGFSALEQSLAGVAAFLRYLRPEFIEALSEPL